MCFPLLTGAAVQLPSIALVAELLGCGCTPMFPARETMRLQLRSSMRSGGGPTWPLVCSRRWLQGSMIKLSSIGHHHPNSVFRGTVGYKGSRPPRLGCRTLAKGGMVHRTCPTE
jgi:hypothetical protein